MKKQTTLSLIFLAFFLTTTFTTLLVTDQHPVVPATASEEEEHDGFTIMPNYRYKNESTTDEAVQEQIEGDIYSVYNANNSTSGNQEFAKSRPLNSRDYYFESRFQLDIAGNRTEYFRNILNDPMDFTEDIEGFVYGGGVVITATNEGGFLKCLTGATGAGDIKRDVSPYWQIGAYTTVSITGKSNNDLSFNIRFWDLKGAAWRTAITDTFTDTLTEFTGNMPAYDTLISIDLQITFQSTSDIVWIDEIKVTGDLDFASHVDGQVEDTWNWEDSQEYFLDSLGNVSDFNDGTIEQYDAIGGLDSLTVTNDGWANLTDSDHELDFIIHAPGLSVGASTYKYVCAEIRPVGANITTIYVGEDALSMPRVLYTDATGVSDGSYYLLSGQLNATYWTGTENDIYFEFRTDAVPASIYVNFTYLYSVSKGDLEGYTGLTREYVNPEGFYAGTCAALSYDAITHTVTEIYSGSFDYLKFSIMSYSAVKYFIQFRASDDSYHDFTDDYINLTTGSWNDIEIDLSADPDWYVHVYWKQFIIYIRDSDGTNLDGNELILLDHVLILGHWSSNDGFKYSLLDQDSEEGLYFQFTREQDSSEYTLHVDFLDASGIALDYELDFNYSRSVDGWLYLKVEMHIEKKTLNLKFRHENDTDILTTRQMSDLFPATGTGQLIIFGDGFPRFCLNNSMPPLARSLVLIDYIDANWQVNEWIEPGGTFTNDVLPTYLAPCTQSSDSDFTSVSQYNALSYKKNSTDVHKFYYVDIDRFDGLNFEVKLEGENIETQDSGHVIFTLYNVQTDGSLERVITAWYATYATGPGAYYYIYADSSLRDYGGAAGSNDATGKLAVHLDPNGKLITQYVFETGAKTVHRQTTTLGSYTKEWVGYFLYYLNTTSGGSTDDELSIEISGFEIKRKDMLGGFIGSTLYPITDTLGSLLLGPLNIILLFLASVFKSVGNFIVDLLTIPLQAIEVSITAMSDAVTGAINNIQGWLSTVSSNITGAINNIQGWLNTAAATMVAGVVAGINNIEDWINNAMTALVVPAIQAIQGYFETWIRWLEPYITAIPDAVFDILWAAATELISLGAVILFTVWDALGLPDLIALTVAIAAIIEVMWELIVDALAAIPSTLQYFFDLFTFWHWVPFALMWALIVLVPAITAESPVAWIDEMLHRFFWNISPGSVQLLGFTVFPSRVPVCMALVPATLFILGVWIW